VATVILPDAAGELVRFELENGDGSTTVIQLGAGNQPLPALPADLTSRSIDEQRRSCNAVPTPRGVGTAFVACHWTVMGTSVTCCGKLLPKSATTMKAEFAVQPTCRQVGS
jgi:hypothetical protein